MTPFDLKTTNPITSWIHFHKRHLLRQHQSVKPVGIHPTKDEPSAAAEDGWSPTVSKQPKLDVDCGQQTTDDKEPMKLVAGYVVDDSTTAGQILGKIAVTGN